jgi:hypothetical protein
MSRTSAIVRIGHEATPVSWSGDMGWRARLALGLGRAAVAAALLANGYCLVLWASAPDASAQPPGPPAATEPAPPPPLDPRGAVPAPARPGVAAGAAAPAAALEPVRQEVTDRRWSAVEIVLLPEDLGRTMGPSVKAGLDGARNDDMGFCFREPQRAGEVAPEATATWRPRRTGSLDLYLETRKGAVDVVDARVARPGTLPPEVLECCREVLRGLEIHVPVAEKGARFRYLYEIEE